jgi:hypothetical protein
MLACNIFSLVSDNTSNGIPDTGCSKHFIGPDTPCTDKRPVQSRYTVGLPNGNTMSATHTALLPDTGLLPPLSTLARRAHVFDTMTNHPLLSIGQFCDDGYHATFTSDAVQLSKNGSTFTIGTRNHVNGLWTVDLSNKPSNSPPTPIPVRIPLVNSAQSMKTLADLVLYFHRACFSPVVKTWTQAIDAGFFATWPGLTSALVRKHLPKSVSTAKGHLRQDRKNVRSTQSPAIIPAVLQPTVLPTSDSPQDSTVRSNCTFSKVVSVTGKVYSDQTGRFPQTSSRGNKYIMVFYDYDSSAILAEPLKSRSESELLRAFTKLHQTLADRGLQPALHILDNECPKGLKAYIRNAGATLQLAPPYIHRTNAAEKAIDIWKCHFISGLSSVDPAFPMHLWCRLIDQATTTLNLLRPARLNRRLSAEAYLHGNFDYNRTPLAPPGTKVLIHETPAHRRTWDPHGVDGWYIGAAPEHYRCHRVYVTKTRAERIAKTVEFFPHQCAMPKTSSADAATRAAQDLIHALDNPSPAAPFATLGADQLHAIRKLAEIFQTTTTQPPTVPLHNPSSAPPTAPLPRVPITPIVSPPMTGTPVGPPRVPLTDPPVNRARPQLILPEHDDPVLHRYRLRSRANNVTQQQASAVIDQVTGQSLEYRALSTGPDQDTWVRALANDLGRLAQGVGTRMPTGTNTIVFIARHAVPSGRKVTYARLVSSIRPTKEETHRVRVTVGGDKLDFPGVTTTQCASLTTTKCLLNSTVSTPDAKFLVLDVKNYYYGTPMTRYEYMKLALKLIPQEIIDQYNLLSLAVDGYVYIEIRKGMPGLKQAGRIANDRLQAHLATYGYAPVPRTPSLWQHESRPVTFSLVVDDFGVKYVGQENAAHLISALKALYQISVDWSGTLYLGLALKWDYDNRTVAVSMPGYVRSALHKFQHTAPTRRQDAPHSWNQPTYGAKVQYADEPDSSPPLDSKSVTLVQKIAGTFLYYAMAVDATMLVALGSIASTQANATEKTYDEVLWLLNYASSNPDATILYTASDMVLHVHSDGSYLSEPKARSRAGGHFFLSDLSLSPTKEPTTIPTPNGPIFSLSRIIRNVMGSAAEAEIASSYMNGQEAVPIRTTLEEMGHPQPPTPVQVDNSTAQGFANDTIKQKRSKAIDMRFYWIQDRTRQGQFLIYWRPGADNLGDYHTKHFSAAHHRLMRPNFLHTTNRLAHNAIHLLLRGCVKSPGTHCPDGTRDSLPRRRLRTQCRL